MSTISSKVPKAAILAAVIILLFESVVAWDPARIIWPKLYLYSDPKQRDDALRFHGQIKAFEKKGKAAVFLLGSSQMREDVDVRIMSNLLNVRREEVEVVNLAVSDGATIDLYSQLDPVLAKKPDLLVVMPLWPSFYMDYEFQKLKYYLSSWETFWFLAKLYGPKRFFREIKKQLPAIVLANILPSYRFKKSFAPIFWHRMTEGRRREPELFAYRAPKPPSYFESEIVNPTWPVLQITPETDVEKELFRHFVKRIKSRGARLLVVDAPFHPYFYKLSSVNPEVLTDYQSFMKQMSEEFHFPYYHEEQLPSFEARDFTDFSHLNAPARRRMSEFILDLVGKFLVK